MTEEKDKLSKVNQSIVEKGKDGIDSITWAQIFDVQRVTHMKPLPVDTNRKVAEKTKVEWEHPHKIGEFLIKISSRTSDREFINDSSELKYLHLPPPNVKISLDLNHGYDMVSDIHWGKPSNSKLDELLKWILLHLDEFKSPQKHITRKLNTDFICTRGVLKKIIYTPYDKNIQCLISATKFKGTIYLCEFEETTPLPNDNINKDCFGGLRFEQYVTSSDPDTPPNPNHFEADHHEYCAVMRSRLNSGQTSHSLVFRAELDCVDPDLEPEPGLLNNFVELKTIQEKIMRDEYKYQGFLRNKALKWWGQSYLAGVPVIIAGYKDNNNVVNKLKRFDLDEIRRLGAKYWLPNVCLNFMNQFLNHVKELVTIDDPNVVYQFVILSQNDITCTRLQESGDFQILPDWYITQLSK